MIAHRWVLDPFRESERPLPPVVEEPDTYPNKHQRIRRNRQEKLEILDELSQAIEIIKAILRNKMGIRKRGYRSFEIKSFLSNTV
ncbi:hypothetical protein Avbf_13368 [Armadillidium vulgare]|nr:hypothetical protein Avbf_13368 [Armadillidium vulgare]